MKGRYYIKQVESVRYQLSYAHCGVEIFSMSKTIMNQVFNCADELTTNMYYQVTDSIHLNYEDVSKVDERYKQQNTQTVGEHLCICYIKFDMDGACGVIYAKVSLVTQLTSIYYIL